MARQNKVEEEAEGATVLLSENAVAKLCGVNLPTFISYRKKGRIVPARQINYGNRVLRLYDVAECKKFFATDPEFLANRAVRRGQVTAESLKGLLLA